MLWQNRCSAWREMQTVLVSVLWMQTVLVSGSLSLWQTPWQNALYFPDCHEFGMWQNYFRPSIITWVVVCPDSWANKGVAGLNSDLHGRIPEMLVSIRSQTWNKKNETVEQSFCLGVSWTVASVLFCTPPFPKCSRAFGTCESPGSGLLKLPLANTMVSIKTHLLIAGEHFFHPRGDVVVAALLTVTSAFLG